MSVSRSTTPGRWYSGLKTPWRDGTAHFVISPLEFMKRLAALVPTRPDGHASVSEHTAAEPTCTHRQPACMSWARLLRLMFQIDLEHGPNCGGQLKIVAAILESAVIERILMHLGLQVRELPRTPTSERRVPHAA